MQGLGLGGAMQGQGQGQRTEAKRTAPFILDGERAERPSDEVFLLKLVGQAFKRAREGGKKTLLRCVCVVRHVGREAGRRHKEIEREGSTRQQPQHERWIVDGEGWSSRCGLEYAHAPAFGFGSGGVLI